MLNALALTTTPAGPAAGKRKAVCVGGGSAGALAIAETVRAGDRLVMVVAASPEAAEVLERELALFLAAEPDCAVLHLPDREILPYDVFSPHQDIISDRLATLHQLSQVHRGVLVTPVTTILQRLPPTDYVLTSSLVLNTGERIDIQALRARLERAGYRAVDTVYEHGEFAVRGSITDIFPMGSARPYRVDLLDDEIDSLRTFDPENQRTIDRIDHIRLLPAREFPLHRQAIRQFKEQWHAQFDVDHRHCPLYADISAGITPPGAENYLPLFFESTALIADYLPDDALVILEHGAGTAAEQFLGEVRERYEEHRHDPTLPLLAPSALYADGGELFGELRRFGQLLLEADGSGDTGGLPEVAVDPRASEPWRALQQFLDNNPGRVLVCAETAGRREALLEQLQPLGLNFKEFDHWRQFIADGAALGITVAPLERGLWLREQHLALITESQLFGHRVLQRRRRKTSAESGEHAIRNLAELTVGAPIVHIDHGVGRYHGLTTITVDEQPAEFLTIAYASDVKLYVPVSSLHLVNRYAGSDGDHAPLHRLGSDQWRKAREKAAREVRDVAAELLDIYARRAAREGVSISADEQACRSFAAGFPFEETPDQQEAIDAVLADLAGKQPMDRLVCGDVGFGKTEVAMRAAFVAVHNNRQVAVLVPTTLLAQQHYETFRDRFADWPVNIEVISRFRTAKEQAKLIEQLAAGRVDIIIGTHKLLNKSISYHDLGLVIIDEEHRFGVRQKEKLKALRAEIDILTLTATPIPRTLNMAMAGMRDLSIIATPPSRRLSVRTFVRRHDRRIIKEAVLREILRGGQVYYVHNEVKSIERAARELGELVTEARIGVGHGQMRERDLERVMSDFYHKRFNILVCSTIIETGIDVPSANTIILERADRFGLAQLHQLRGRVGRSHHQAYAYLLTPEPKAMTSDAVKRLEAIAEAQDLGAGFTLATNDLEIRGAGELLGDEQSGHIQAVGFSLYMDMLERAIQAAQRGETFTPEANDSGPEINLHIAALIPSDYLPDVHSRLTLYKRIAGAGSRTALDELQVEMIDRFGLLPEQARHLIRVTALKLTAAGRGIDKIEANQRYLVVEFAPNTAVDPLAIVRLMQRDPEHCRLEGGSRLRIERPTNTTDERFRAVDELLVALPPATDREQPTGT